MQSTTNRLEETVARHQHCVKCAKVSALRAKMARDPDSRSYWLDSKRSWEDMAAYWLAELNLLKRDAA